MKKWRPKFHGGPVSKVSGQNGPSRKRGLRQSDKQLNGAVRVIVANGKPIFSLESRSVSPVTRNEALKLGRSADQNTSPFRPRDPDAGERSPEDERAPAT